MGFKSFHKLSIILLCITIIFAFVGFFAYKSNENNGISLEEDSKLSPSHPTNVKSSITPEAIDITWLGTGDDRIKFYTIFGKDQSNAWVALEYVKADGSNSNTYEFSTKDDAFRKYTAFGVSATNQYNRESAITPSQNLNK